VSAEQATSLPARATPVRWAPAVKQLWALEKDIRSWVAEWNENPKPFIWTKSAERILESLKRLLQRINGAGH
jgi:hypothetical protein